jgi:hypothetical protein
MANSGSRKRHPAREADRSPPLMVGLIYRLRVGMDAPHGRSYKKAVPFVF